jgi:bis(5'-nucleosyl)-tetraphosphatase (symmetrical)
MYGDTPLRWADDLAGWDRLRFITNCLTRIRFCDAEGNLELGEKGPPNGGPSGYLPWYEVADRRNRDLRVIFGHWSTLSLADTTFERHNVFPLDTGCVWGGELSALRLEDRRYFQVSADHSKN